MKGLRFLFLMQILVCFECFVGLNQICLYKNNIPPSDIGMSFLLPAEAVRRSRALRFCRATPAREFS